MQHEAAALRATLATLIRHRDELQDRLDCGHYGDHQKSVVEIGLLRARDEITEIGRRLRELDQ